MTIVLISKQPAQVLNVWPDQATVNVNVPGILQAYSVGAGWVSPDGNYELVEPVAFQPPDGQVATGVPRYELGADGVVTEVCDTIEAPPAPPVTVSPLDFIGLFTTAEALAITTASQTDPQIALFLTMSSAADAVVMNDPRTVDGLNYLVSKNLITADRMAQIVAGTKPESSGDQS